MVVVAGVDVDAVAAEVAVAVVDGVAVGFASGVEVAAASLTQELSASDSWTFYFASVAFPIAAAASLVATIVRDVGGADCAPVDSVVMATLVCPAESLADPSYFADNLAVVVASQLRQCYWSYAT